MKKLIALLAVFLGVALLLGLLWRLATGNTSHQQTNAGSNDLFSAAVERVEEYADNFSNGWDDLAWANARGYIAGRSTVASASGATVFSDEEISLLHDKFAVRVLEKLYSHIASQLNARTPKMSVAGNHVLKNDYRGLDSLAKYYAAIPPTAKYQELKKTRSALDGAYSFAMQNFAAAPCMNPSLSFSAPEYSLSYSRPFDYPAYANRVEARRAAVQSAWKQAPLLASVKWISESCDKDAVAQKLAAAHRAYEQNEAAALGNFFRDISSPESAIFADNTTRSALLALSRASDAMLRTFLNSASQLPESSRKSLTKYNENLHEKIAESARRFQ